MRRFLWSSLGVLLLASITVASSGGATQAEARWVVTDLGTLGKGYWASTAQAINDRGQIVGTSLNREEMFVNGGRAFLWEQGKMRALGAARSLRYSQAWDINEQGVVVGSSFSIDADNGRLFKSLATVWKNGRGQELPADRSYRGSDYQSEAMAVNEQGDVVGWDYFGARLWRGGAMQKVASDGLATAINERGQIVGILGGMDPNGRWGPLGGFLWENGEVRNLGQLGGFGWRDSHENWISAISDAGVIVGGRKGHATTWAAGVPRRLPEAKSEPRQRSWANGMNERGQIVGGWRPTPEGRLRAALWENGTMSLLPGLSAGRNRAEAFGINERGQIVGWAYTGKEVHAVLWTLKP